MKPSSIAELHFGQAMFELVIVAPFGRNHFICPMPHLIELVGMVWRQPFAQTSGRCPIALYITLPVP